MGLILDGLIKIDRNARRLREIVAVFAKYGLADWLKGLHYEWLQDLFRSPDGQRLAECSTAERIRLAITELGPTFIKFGQVLSTRPDLVGAAIATELSRLQSDAPPSKPEAVSHMIETELGRDLQQLFASFDAKPLASASIGQVHRARLFSGEDAVVKVQHEGIEAKVESDLELLRGLAELAERHAPFLRPYRPLALTKQFRRVLLRELDFSVERRNLETFARNFAGDETIHFPMVYPELCGRRVLTMERLEGVEFTDAAGLRASGADLGGVAARGAAMYLDMIFRDGFYHADPHPGNLMLLNKEVIGVIDGGMVGRMDQGFREDIENMLLAAVERDGDELTEVVVRVGKAPVDFRSDDLRGELGEFLEEFIGLPLEEFDISETLSSLIEIVRSYHIVLPPSFSLLLKTLIMLEGTSRRLDRRFNLFELLRPYYSKALHRRLAPPRLLRRAQRSYRDWSRLADSLPRDVTDIVGRLRRGSFDVHIEHRRLEVIVNRLVVGILTAALFMGSAQMLGNRLPPTVYGISVFGLAGALAAVALGLHLLLVIHKSGDIRSKD
ncbi:MAG TPA: AarF/ABC1/UbiB kinase family protein [Verrucomicrobiales bacterium]|nr:AarF/ABC1/UbiB kinase family protein [Verrucomicrobiales bacterium]